MLTDAQIKRIKPDIKTRRYTDEKSMYLEVTLQGGMYWRMKYRIEGKEKRLSIGVYPTTTLADARRKRDTARQQLANGIDPNADKQQAKRIDNQALLFSTIGLRWLEGRQDSLTASSYQRDIGTAQNDLFPSFGHMPIDQIRSPDILAMAIKIQDRGSSYMARRAISLAGRIFRQAMLEGLASHDPTTGIGNALKPHIVQNMARIEAKDLPKLLTDMAQYQGDPQVRLGFKLLNLCFVRTKELRFMEWSDIDFDAKLWRIPAEKMKKKRPHLVPLCRQALAVLLDLQHISGHQKYAFYNTATRKP